MDEMRFDGRVAVVTGAGRGLGLAHAKLLASRGAKVVLNDLGTEVDGSGTDRAVAEHAAAEIVEAGGEAVANTGDITDLEQARALIDQAVETYGRIDILINNAGVIRDDKIESLDVATMLRVLSVHVFGTFQVTQAAWAHFQRQQYGRIVTTISAAALGAPGIISYSTAKGAVLSMSRTLAGMGKDHNIRVNILCPSALTRMVGNPERRRASGVPLLEESQKVGRTGPEGIAPVVAFLAHESVPFSGEILVTTGTNVGRMFFGETKGLINDEMSPELIRDNWSTIADEKGYFVPVITGEHHAKRTELSLV